jgi:nitronate monooxygenase
MSKAKAETLLSSMRIPVIAAPMFLVSTPKLVIEACKSGIAGTIPLLNARSEDILEKWMDQINHELTLAKRQQPERKIAPWGVNLIVHKSNRRMKSDLEMIRKFKPPIVITALGNPENVTDIIHEYGGLVFSDVATLSQAKKAAQTGVDGLILVCGGAGGHGGTLNPIAFLGAVKKFWSGITILAGGISNGDEILAARAMGADFAYMGTRFIASKEANADEYDSGRDN